MLCLGAFGFLIIFLCISASSRRLCSMSQVGVLLDFWLNRIFDNNKLLISDRCRRDTVSPVWDGLMPAVLAGISNWKSTLQPSTAPLVPSLPVSSAAVCVVQFLALLSSLVVHRHGKVTHH
jgi:hypothetical protein